MPKKRIEPEPVTEAYLVMQVGEFQHTVAFDPSLLNSMHFTTKLGEDGLAVMQRAWDARDEEATEE